MNTVAFKKASSMFGDSEFQKTELEHFATVLFFLAIARQSWDIPKDLIAHWHANYVVQFLKKGWLRQKREVYEMTLIFQGQGERAIEFQLALGNMTPQFFEDDEPTFEVGRYTVRVEECKGYVKQYLAKEVAM